MAEQQRKPLPFIANFTAGAIAGVSEILTFYPLDVVSTRTSLRERLRVWLAPSLQSSRKRGLAGCTEVSFPRFCWKLRSVP
ncbi:hypothetical protein AX14_007824 [Amanita brunnescens Koide BX004]|nr:hypothetical protein AX14_007824 [Amanita brunnescens Koide BX004]